MTTPNNRARDQRRAEARVLRAARETLIRELEVETTKPTPDTNHIAFLTVKLRKLDATLERYERKDRPKPKKADGRATPEKLRKELEGKPEVWDPREAYALVLAQRRGVSPQDKEGMAAIRAELKKESDARHRWWKSPEGKKRLRDIIGGDMPNDL